MGVYKLSGAGGLLTPRVNYTSMLAGNEAFVAEAYELIETHILASAASEVTFSSLATYASTYKHLQIRMTVRTTRTDSNSDFILFRFNGISTAGNYIAHRLFGNGSSVNSEAVSGQNGIFLQRYVTADAANIFGGSVLDILDPYSTTKNKTIREFSGFFGAVKEVNLNSGLSINTASTTSLTLIGGSVAFAAGCRFSLYGIKG